MNADKNNELEFALSALIGVHRRPVMLRPYLSACRFKRLPRRGFAEPQRRDRSGKKAAAPCAPNAPRATRLSNTAHRRGVTSSGSPRNRTSVRSTEGAARARFSRLPILSLIHI